MTLRIRRGAHRTGEMYLRVLRGLVCIAVLHAKCAEHELGVATLVDRNAFVFAIAGDLYTNERTHLTEVINLESVNELLFDVLDHTHIHLSILCR